MNIKFKHLVEEVDRHGNPRIYVRIKGRPKVRIRAMPGTPEFMVAYQAAMAKQPSVDDDNRHHSPAKGTFGHACLAYYASPTFKALDIKTQDGDAPRSIKSVSSMATSQLRCSPSTSAFYAMRRLLRHLPINVSLHCERCINGQSRKT
jgi:hypothetical protein